MIFQKAMILGEDDLLIEISEMLFDLNFIRKMIISIKKTDFDSR